MNKMDALAKQETRRPTLAAMGYKTTARVESLRKDGHRLEVRRDERGHWVVKCYCARCKALRRWPPRDMVRRDIKPQAE